MDGSPPLTTILLALFCEVAHEFEKLGGLHSQID